MRFSPGKKGLALAGAGIMAWVGGGATAALATPPSAPPAAGRCPGLVGQNDAQPPAGSKLIINAVMKVTNDEDSGFVGYWALDAYNKHIRVWQTPSGYYYAVATYDGQWQTFSEALSPGNGVTEPSNGSGPMIGGYVLTFDGTLLNPPSVPTHGNIGTYDFGGTKSDVLLGKYANGQVGDSSPTDWVNLYFSGVSNENEPVWGWQYRYPTQTWCNTSVLPKGSGDIVTR